MRAAITAILALAACSSTAAPPPARSPVAQPPPAQPRAGLDPLLVEFAYPFPVAFHEVTAQRQRLRMAYIDVGPTAPSNGRAVLLLHGKNFSAAYWAPTIRALAAQGFRIIAPDQIGFGKSDKPERFQYSFEALAQLTASLLDARGVDRVSVVGHSMGGMLATRLALVYPQRIEQLALINPIGLEDYRAHVPPASLDELYAKELAATPDSLRDYMRKAYFAGEWKPEYEPLLEILAGWTQHRDYPVVAWAAALTADMIMTQPVVHDFPRVAVPTLLVIGQRDRTALGKDRAPPDVAAKLGDYPALGRRTARAIPNAKLVELAGVGHLPQVEAFDAYRSALLAFLAGTSGSAP